MRKKYARTNCETNGENPRIAVAKKTRNTTSPQVLMNLPVARVNELSVLLPDQWKQLHAARIAN